MLQEIEAGFFAAETFEDIKPIYTKLFGDNKVATLYKMRNWRERFHPEFLTKGEIYFARPNELNDPFDIHRPVRFDVSVIDTPAFLEKFIQTAPLMRGINPGRDAVSYAENELEKIRIDPHSYFLKNYIDLINNPAYNNQIGVLSLTYNLYDDQLWGYYGGGQRGFAVGFDPLLLCEDIFSQGSFINYTDEIPVSGIINVALRTQTDLMFQKNKRWGFEKEFRFIRILENRDRRIHHYSPEIVKEIILGARIPEDDEEEIINIRHNIYPQASVYKIEYDYTKASMFRRKLL